MHSVINFLLAKGFNYAGAVYFMIGNLDAAFRSRLEAINLIALFNCDLLSHYSLDDVLSPFINDLKQLDDVSVTNMYLHAKMLTRLGN